MYFYVFLEPNVFEEALADGQDAMQNIAAILKGFLQNCFLAVFEDDRWGLSIKEKLKDWPETSPRSHIKKMLAHLKKQRRFLDCLKPDYLGAKSDHDCVFDQALSVRLDLLLMVACEKRHSSPAGVEIATRRTYHDSAFEEKRTELAVYGKTCNPGEMEEAEFLEFHFAKALRHATEIHLCDRVCGHNNLADNFRYTTRKLMAWLGANLDRPKSCRIVFHLGQPRGHGMDFVISELSSFRNRSRALSEALTEVHFYGEGLPDPRLPHQRFILTDQVALNVDRGLDFFDRNTQKCRDTYVNYQKPEEAQRLLDGFAPGRTSSHRL